MECMCYHTAYYLFTVKSQKYIFKYSRQKDKQQLKQSQLQNNYFIYRIKCKIGVIHLVRTQKFPKN